MNQVITERVKCRDMERLFFFNLVFLSTIPFLIRTQQFKTRNSASHCVRQQSLLCG